ncbi:MAG: hypothetical protein P8188_16715 [Gemmatimonadota bacterium]
MSFLRTRSVAVFLLAAAAGTLGCSDESSPTVPDPGTGDLECEILNYPCSLAEVDLPILLRSNELGDSVLARLERGASTAEAADWLAEQDGIVDAMSGNLGVWFRLDGGRGTWVVTEGALLSEPDPSAAAVGPEPSRRAPARVPDRLWVDPRSGALPRPTTQAVAPASADGRSETGLSALAGISAWAIRSVGSGSAAPSGGLLEPPRPRLDIVGSGSEEKRALVLSPYAWGFQGWDSGPAVRDILQSTRGYENGVDFAQNADSMATDVGLTSFMGWGAYDVIHVDSHGSWVCDDEGCRGVLVVNPLYAFFPAGLSEVEQIEKLKEVNQPGVELVKSKGGGFIGVNADFFHRYANDLEDAVIVLNACQLFESATTDLVDALAGAGNVVFGWTEAVYSSDAYRAASRLFEELSEGGYPAEVAYEKLGDLRTGRATRHGPSPTLRMARRPSGGDLQIREVVTLLDPASGQELAAEDRVQIEGIPGDGEEDAAPFLVQVDGVLADDADDVILRVSVDDVESDPVPVSSGTPNEKDQWIIQGQVPLGYDLEEDRPVDFLARVELASEGESEHRSGAILTGASWTLVSEGEMTGLVTLHGSTAEGAETWSAEADFAVDEGGRIVGNGVGTFSGTELVFSFDDEELFCLIAAPVQMSFVFDLAGQTQDGLVHLETENLEAPEFSSGTCEGVSEAQIEASLLAIVSATLETNVALEHEAVQEEELPASGPLSHDGVVVGSYETLYRWVNTIRKAGCTAGTDDPDC